MITHLLGKPFLLNLQKELYLRVVYREKKEERRREREERRGREREERRREGKGGEGRRGEENTAYLA